MTVSVLFLGPLQDCEGTSEREFDAPLTWSRLLSEVTPPTREQMETGRVNVACAGKVLASPTDLQAQSGDEVALLPPVSGG